MKHKACLSVHSGMQQWGVNYCEIYAPVVNWISVCTLLTITSIHEVKTCLIDFILAFPQDDLDVNALMETPMGMKSPKGPGYVLKLKHSVTA